jgi:pimeloyl-ACP methyl ester carboxylesterase
MKLRSVILCFTLLLLLPACNATQLTGTPVPEMTPTARSQGEIVSLTAEDGLLLSGTIYRAEGDLAVVYAHMGIIDQTSWQAFAAEAADQGMTALTFDFRCFGLSKCNQGNETELHLLDILSAIRYLRDQGYQRIVCMGASMGAAACLQASMQEDLAGLVFIAGEREILFNGNWYPDDIVNPGMPKLFIVAEQDPYSVAVEDTQRYYKDSPEPKQLILYPESVHGTDLFATSSGGKFHQVLIDFLRAIK